MFTECAGSPPSTASLSTCYKPFALVLVTSSLYHKHHRTSDQTADQLYSQPALTALEPGTPEFFLFFLLAFLLSNSAAG